MAKLEHEAIKKFCAICDWTHRVWNARRIVFDDNERLDEYQQLSFVRFMEMLALITKEYALLQIAMLHDPATQGGNENLTIDRIVSDEAWDGSTRAQLETLRTNLDSLAKRIKDARNKVLAHIDLDAALRDVSLGAFPDGDDSRYFDLLQQFVNIIHDKAIGGTHPLYVASDCNEATEFVSALLEQTRGARKRRMLQQM